MGYIDVSYQAVTFFLSVGLGVLMCVFYDILRALHRASLKGFFEVLVTDILFWSISAFLTYCFLLLRCQGNVRGFVLIGQLIGFLTVRVTVSRWLLKAFAWFFGLFFAVFKVISAKFYQLAEKSEKNIKKSFNKLKKHLKVRAKLLYNQLKVKKNN